MNYGRWLENLMAMDEATWARHANPWSVWTRVPVLPLFALAVWSRAWLSWWCLVPAGLLVLWTLYNPRAFPPPAITDTWASKATFGERVWLNRKAVPIPDHHARFAHILSAVSAIGLLPMAYGLWAYEPFATGLGVVLVIIGKLWFLDRMVWLYDNMRVVHPDYAAWLRRAP